MTAAGSLAQLTQSGHDSNPEWSPDGRWIAFLSDREGGEPAEKTDKTEKTEQVYAISANGGEAFAVTHGDEKVHAFAWSADSRQIYFATRAPWSKEQQETYKKEWKDVVEFRESERGDAIGRIEIATNTAKADCGYAMAREAAGSLARWQAVGIPDGFDHRAVGSAGGIWHLPGGGGRRAAAQNTATPGHSG